MDRLTPEQRHKTMQAVKSKDTKIEILLRQELWSRGLRYRKNSKDVYGHPDIVFVRKKIAVFCDSEFWHGFDWENRKNDFKSNQDFWIAKIERNISRDIEVNDYLTSHGWEVLRFWGKQIENDTVRCADVIEKAVNRKAHQ